DLVVVAFHDRHARVGRAEVDADDLAHGVFSLSRSAPAWFVGCRGSVPWVVGGDYGCWFKAPGATRLRRRPVRGRPPPAPGAAGDRSGRSPSGTPGPPRSVAVRRSAPRSSPRGARGRRPGRWGPPPAGRCPRRP